MALLQQWRDMAYDQQADKAKLQQFWATVKSLKTSTSNSTPTVKRPFCSSGQWTSLSFARLS